MEYHAQLATVCSDSLDQLFLVANARHLSDAKRVILLQNIAQAFEVLVAARTARVVFMALEHFRIRVGKCLVFANKVDDIDAKAISASV